MDARHFDALVRVLGSSEPRRRLLGLLAAVPLLGGIVGLLGSGATLAKERRRRRKQRHKRRKGKNNAKRKHRKSCQPKSRASVCAGTCGIVKNKRTCGKQVDCGSCACEPACGDCFVCDEATRTCVVDPAQVGDPCGSAGQVCGDNGSCACSATSCPACQQCGDDGRCVGCDGCCDGEACVSDCGDCRTCGDDGQCAACSGCCDAGTCVDDCGDCRVCGSDGQCAGCPGCCDAAICVSDCGHCRECGPDGQCEPCRDCCDAGTCVAECPACTRCEGGTCRSCADLGLLCCGGLCAEGICCDDNQCLDPKKPNCVGGDCTCAANANTPCDGTLSCCASGCVDLQNDAANCGTCGTNCGASGICVAGVCRTCTVTCDAADHKCAGTALQTAINGGGTVYVCPGEYTGRFTVGQDASVTIVGAGTGDNPATSTILKTTNYVNLEVTSATSCAVTRLRIEGNLGDSESPPSSGLRIVDSHATFTNCDFSRFGPKYNTHAFRTLGSTVELVNCLLHNSHNSVSGGVRVEGGSLTLNRTTIRNNSTVNFGGGIDVEEAGTVTLSNGSLITENRAGPEGGGGIYAAAGTTVNISSDSTVVANLDVNNEISNCQGAGTFNGTCG